MGMAIIICGTILTSLFMIGIFVSERDESHFDRMLKFSHERKLAKMKNELAIEEIKFRALNSPMPETDRK